MPSTNSSTDNHYLSLLLPAFSKHASRTVFKPLLTPDLSWGSITFRQWTQYLEIARCHWSRSLQRAGLKRGDIVGMWLTGQKWTDLLSISSVSAAGYVPQLFSNIFTSEIIHTLLIASKASLLLYDSRDHPDVPKGLKIPSMPSLEASDLEQLLSRSTGAILAQSALPAVQERTVAVIFHSSGTTSGVPKLIPSSHLLLKMFITHKFPDCLLHGETDPSSSVLNSLGSLAHVGSFQAFLGAAAHGCCTVQSSSMAMSSAEMVAMTRTCGLNRLVQYATFVSVHIRAAHSDPDVKRALQGLKQILYTGVALDAQDTQWALEHGLRLTSMYGTSETAPLLISRSGPSASARLLRPCSGASPLFVPHVPSNVDDTDDVQRPVLYEIVVAPDAPDAPPAALFHSDGFWHTGDLFERVCSVDGEPEGWMHRGRAGDWIKTCWGFVDTRTIEDTVRRECPAVVFDAVVVGSSRAHPVLIVEAHETFVPFCRKQWIAAHVVEKTAHANVGMFHYERIGDQRWVIVVEKGSLPRTKEKGNIRRNATEELYKVEIDAVFA